MIRCYIAPNDYISGQPDCADAQADLDLRCPRGPEDTFPHDSADQTSRIYENGSYAIFLGPCDKVLFLVTLRIRVLVKHFIRKKLDNKRVFVSQVIFFIA